MEFHNDEYFRVDRLSILSGIFASGELDDVRAIFFTDALMRSEAISCCHSRFFPNESFVDFVKDTLLNKSYTRALGCMNFLLCFAEEWKEHMLLTNIPSNSFQYFGDSALVCFQRNCTNSREQCILVGMCCQFCYSLGCNDKDRKKYYLSKLHIMELMKDIEQIYKHSSSSSDTLESYSIEKEFNTIFVLNFLDLFITSDCLPEETRLRNCVFYLTHIPTLQQVGIVMILDGSCSL